MDIEETLLLFGEEHPCWTEKMLELAGGSAGTLNALFGAGLLREQEGVFFLTPDGAARFSELAEKFFLPIRPGAPGVSVTREANRSLLQILLDKRHQQRWGLKEYRKPFRFELPALSGDELFTIEAGKLTWRYPDNPVFAGMARDFPVTGLAARKGPPPSPERVAAWKAANMPIGRTMEADLLYKSRYDFQAYLRFPKLPCDPCDMLNTDRFLFFFAPPSGGEKALLPMLGEFHMFLTMMRRMYLPGYVDLDSLDQDGINWLVYVYENEEDALKCAGILARMGSSLAGPAAPLEVWSLSLEALWRRDGTAESIHDMLPCTAHPIWRVE